jgi:hypothetical protein
LASPLRRRHADGLRSLGRVRIDIIDVATGHVTRVPDGPNLIVRTGLNVIRDRLMPNSSAGPIEVFGLGSSDGPAAAHHTGLLAEIPPKLGVGRAVAGDTGQLSIQLHITSTQFNGVTIREAGLFTAGNVLVARYVLPIPVIKTVARAVTFTWDIQFVAG